MRKSTLVLFVALFLPGAEAARATQDSEKTYDALFIGHSFFVPVARRFRELARTAGITRHSQQEVFKGGAGGAPGSLWKDPRIKEQIERHLKTGTVDLLGMTYYDRSNSSIEDYRRWIDLALKHNPRTTFFLGMPWSIHGGSRDLEEYSSAGKKNYRKFRKDILAPLREQYPDTRFICVYYGLASIELKKRFHAENLPGISQLTGRSGSVYTDKLGHGGAILKDTAALVWLSVIYKVDVSKTDLQLKHKADLSSILEAIKAEEAALRTAKEKGVRRTLEAAPPPVDNPLKGLVPYAGDYRGVFPHSLEFSYLPLSELVVGPDRYDWAPLEKLLDDIAGRGHQAVFRVFLEYPGRKTGIPRHLLEGGLKVHRWPNAHSGGKPSPEIETPDYEDPALRKSLRDLIARMGEKYDGDPRLGYLTAGLLGLWGEWHDYPKSELFASKEVQAEVMDAYERAFERTPVLHRYPAGEKDGHYASNDGRSMGYHDDSFAWATLETGRPEDSWFFLALMKKAGPKALDKWKTHPIGGEIRPEAWGIVFDQNPGKKEIQDFRACVDQTHATWLMDTGMFRKKQPDARRRRAEEEVRRMGYVFHISAVTIGPAADGSIPVTIEVVNRGVAPFYHDWRPEAAVKSPDGSLSRPVAVRGKMTGLLPGDPPRSWTASLKNSGTGVLLLRVPNPLPKGNPVRFANKSQDADHPGWLTLGTIGPGE